jgi:hypothetical protein
MSDDNIKKPVEYIQLRMDSIKNSYQKDGLTAQISALSTLSQSNPQLIPAVNSLREQVKNLTTSMNSQASNIQLIAVAVVQYRDQAYLNFIDSKISLLTRTDIISGNQPSIIERIKKAVNSDWDSRQSSSGNTSAQLQQPPNRVAAQKYINDVTKAWDEKKLAKASQLSNSTPNSPLKVQLDAMVNDFSAKITHATYVDVKLLDISSKQGTTIPNYVAPDSKPAPSTDLQKMLGNVSQQAGFSAPSFNSSDASYEPNAAPQLTFSQSDAIPIINNEFSSPLITAANLDPLNGIDYSRTQMMKFFGTDDVIDPREVNLIIPPSFGYPVPSYINVFFNDGTAFDKGSPDSKLQLSLPSFENILSPGSNLAYNQFSVQSVSQNYGEKFQIDEVLSPGHAVFSFGSKPKIWQISGTLLNDLVNKWKIKFEEAFENYLCLSACVTNNSYVMITIPPAGIQISCYPVQLDLSVNVNSEGLVPFSMPVIIRDVKRLTQINVSPSIKKMIDILVGMKTTKSALQTGGKDGATGTIPDIGTNLKADGTPAGTILAAANKLNIPTGGISDIAANIGSNVKGSVTGIAKDLTGGSFTPGSNTNPISSLLNAIPDRFK